MEHIVGKGEGKVAGKHFDQGGDEPCEGCYIVGGKHCDAGGERHCNREWVGGEWVRDGVGGVCSEEQVVKVGGGVGGSVTMQRVNNVET